MPMHEYQKQMYTRVAVIAALVILPIAGFFAGTLYQKQMTPAASATNGPQQFGSGPRTLKNRAIGTVKSIAETSVTVTDRMSQEDKTYTLSASTTYKNGETAAKLADIKVGDTVMLTLDESDNAKATGVTLNPVTMFRSSGPEASGSTDMMVQ
jgi:hypothetical protein